MAPGARSSAGSTEIVVEVAVEKETVRNPVDVSGGFGM